jgi:mannitol-specific phosphotransferase system IIBC component
MTNKEKYISAIIGIAIGSTLGILMSSSMIKRNNDYEKLKNRKSRIKRIDIYIRTLYSREPMKKLFKYLQWLQQQKIEAMVHCGQGFN